MKRALLFGAVAGVGAMALSTRFSDDSWPSHIPPMPRVVEQVHPDILSVASPIFGIENLRRMNVVRLNTGGLLIFSGTCLESEEMEAIQALGPVELIVVPAPMHRLDAALYKERFPAAKVVCPDLAREAVERKVAVDALYSEVFAPGNAYGIEYFVAPMKRSNAESVLLVPLSDSKKALLVCDVIQNVDVSGWNTVLQRIAALYLIDNRYGPTVSYGFRNWTSDGGPDAVKQFVRQLSELEPDVLLVCHGDPITTAVTKKLSNLVDRF